MKNWFPFVFVVIATQFLLYFSDKFDCKKLAILLVNFSLLTIVILIEIFLRDKSE